MFKQGKITSQDKGWKRRENKREKHKRKARQRETKLVSPIHDTFKISKKIEAYVAEISSWGVQPKIQTVKGEVKNHIPIWGIRLEYHTITSYPYRPVQSFIEKGNGIMLKIASNRAEPFL